MKERDASVATIIFLFFFYLSTESSHVLDIKTDEWFNDSLKICPMTGANS